MSIQASISRIKSVEQLIAEKMLMIDAKNYHVAMLAELWNIYTDPEKVNFCRNIKNYCDVKNSYDQLPPNRNPTLLVSIKDAQGEVAPYAYLRGSKIELIKNAEAIRNYPKIMTRYVFKLILKIVLLVAAIIAIGIYLF
jgi:hypothetical protein